METTPRSSLSITVFLLSCRPFFIYFTLGRTIIFKKHLMSVCEHGGLLCFFFFFLVRVFPVAVGLLFFFSQVTAGCNRCTPGLPWTSVVLWCRIISTSCLPLFGLLDRGVVDSGVCYHVDPGDL